jgi:transcriptional regulator with XRE-family HTH domain
MSQAARKSHFLGTKLRTLRKRNRLTLEELSARCTQLNSQAAPSVSYLSMIESGKVWAEPDLTWPLRNVHLGVSAETQKWAVTRTKALADTPAAVRFLSLEPLLAPIDLDTVPGIDKVDWVIIGGESGTGARPCELGWIETLVEQCDDLGIAVFVKQLGSVLARQTGAGGKGGDPERWPRPFPREFSGPGRRKIRVAKTVGGVL